MSVEKNTLRQHRLIKISVVKADIWGWGWVGVNKGHVFLEQWFGPIGILYNNRSLS